MRRCITALLVIAGTVGVARAQTFRNASHLLMSPHLSSRPVYGASSVDANGDGLVDIYHVTRLFIQQPDGTFINQLIESGILDGPGDVQGGIWADVDRDGYLDLFTANRTRSSFLHRNGVIGRFQGVASGPIVGSGAVGAVWGDFDGDERLDLFVPDMAGNNRLLVQRSGGFLQLGTSLRTNRPACGAAASDFDENGLPDLYLATCNVAQPAQNEDGLFRNTGNLLFRDLVAEGEISVNSLTTRAAIWLDYDNDGRQDIFVLNHKRDIPGAETIPTHGNDRLYRNRADGTFEDAAGAVGVTGARGDQGYSAAAADFDNDGWMDILVTNWPAEHFPTASDDRLYRNLEGEAFQDIMNEAISTTIPDRAVATVADFDNDGWIDIFFASQDGNRLLLNNGGTNHWLKVSLRGIAGNYSGIGARVELYREGGVQLREIQAGESYASQHHNLTAHFGLGQNPDIDSLVVRWPGGRTDRIIDLMANEWISVVEGVGPKKWPTAPVPQAPVGGTRLPFTDRQVDFVWQSPQAIGEVSYTLYLRGAGLDTTITDIAGKGTSFSTEHLQQGEEYIWSIAATDGYNFRRSSEEFSFWFAGSTIFPALKQSLPFAGVGMGGLDLQDFDGDGDLDLLIAGRSAAGPLARVYETVDTSGTQGEYFLFWKKLRSVTTDMVGLETGSAEWGDYDADGDADVLITGVDGSRPTTLLYENRAGSFHKISDPGLPGIAAGEASFGDFDADGDLDIVIAGATRLSYPFDPITRVYENTGAGYRDVGAQLEGVHHASTAWGDYDADGDLDLAIMGDRAEGDFVTAVYRNDEGRFSVVLSPPGLAYGSMDWGDFDGDGDLDLLVAGSRIDPELLHGWTRIYRNDAGLLTEMPLERDFAQLGMGQVLWKDYDGDGDLDILMIGSETPFKRPRLVAYRNENGRFAIEFDLEGLVFASMAAGDYNADGDIDLFAMGQTVEGEPRLLIFVNQIFPEIVVE